uniref:Reverse transcriptase domain-containing protein n=1 Tax=Cannabis sativa TaxID=3483 RepID=A0A803P621_CANSA
METSSSVAMQFRSRQSLRFKNGLESPPGCNHSPTTTASLKTSESILDDLLEQEEMYWQQRSRIDWLQLGDQNTKFFHSKASARKAKNKIKFLQTEGGLRVTSKHDMAEAIQDYFEGIFQSSSVDEDALAAIIHSIPTTITQEMNNDLTKPFTPSEVKDALFSMGSDKSPDIDGMSAMFYQQHWDIVGDSVCSAVLNVLNHGADPTPLNSTMIMLIPKKKKPLFVKDYRRIALCNVISKLITKVLVGRFKPVLPLIISETQSAFLPNRLITDNILVAFELIHGIKLRTSGGKGVAAMKLDMSKAFRRVEWCFIQMVMEKWVSVRNGLLFCHADESSCLSIKRVRDIYHRASGQTINAEKSNMSFSPNTTLAAQIFFHRTLSMSITDCHETYLGLPAYSGRDKQHMFSDIKEKVWRLMNSWNEKIFSSGGKEILLEVVVQSIPTYAMSCFRLPTMKLICKSKADGGMGFRSFEHFNQALLAKQAWRLITHPTSMLCRLLKSRYFPLNSFQEASHGHSPSLSWQGILYGRELLLEGLRWKVGEGRNIQCGMDPWIPGNNFFLPFLYKGPDNAVVANLITKDRQWDVALLNQYFIPTDVERPHHSLELLSSNDA